MKNKSIELYQLTEQSPIQMMSYVIKSADDKYVVIDGGNTQDAQGLLQFLMEKQKTDKPEIEAWFLTHAHSDHIDAFMHILHDYEKDVIINKVYYNFPERDYIDKYEHSDVHTITEFLQLEDKFKAKAVIINSGDSYNIDGIQYNILTSPNLNITENVLNNSTCVIKVNLSGTDVLFLGDLGFEAGEDMLEKLGKQGLKADIVQMAHHGQAGVSKEVYAAISPTICLWPTPLWLWENNAGEGLNTGPFQTMVVRDWMQELGVKQNIVSYCGTQQVNLISQ